MIYFFICSVFPQLNFQAFTQNTDVSNRVGAGGGSILDQKKKTRSYFLSLDYLKPGKSGDLLSDVPTSLVLNSLD